MNTLQCSCKYEADGISDLATHLLTCTERDDEDIATLQTAEGHLVDRLIRLETINYEQAERIAALEAENARLREAVNWDVVNALAELTELEDALRRIVQLENDSDTSDLVVLRKALRIAVDALGKKEER